MRRILSLIFCSSQAVATAGVEKSYPLTRSIFKGHSKLKYATSRQWWGVGMCIKCLKEGFLEIGGTSGTSRTLLSSPHLSHTNNITQTLHQRPKWSPIENSLWWNQHMTINSFQRDGTQLRYGHAIPPQYLFHLIILPEWGSTFLEYSSLLRYFYEHSVAIWIFDQRSQGHPSLTYLPLPYPSSCTLPCTLLCTLPCTLLYL